MHLAFLELVVVGKARDLWLVFRGRAVKQGQGRTYNYDLTVESTTQPTTRVRMCRSMGWRQARPSKMNRSQKLRRWTRRREDHLTAPLLGR